MLYMSQVGDEWRVYKCEGHVYQTRFKTIDEALMYIINRGENNV